MELAPRIDWMPVKINENVIKGLSADKVLVIIPATKPCFYKLWSIMAAAEKFSLPYIILNPGQHYDELLGHGLKEFNFLEKVAVDLQIRGDLSQKSAELFSKIKSLSTYLKKAFPKVTFVPYVNGDTVTAGILPVAWMFSFNQKVIHGEAGLRGMAPESFRSLKITEPEYYIDKQFNGNWQLLREEPFPEQWDTYVGSAGSQFMFAPVNLNKMHLLREGYQDECIWTVGNTVVDAIGLKKRSKPEESIFSVYPKLESGEWLRIDIHRRGNLTEKRFKAIVGSVIDMVNSGKNVVMVELTATRKALEYYGLRNKLLHLSKRKNFLFTPLWKEYSHVIEFITSQHCWSILTDSGSMQEEMNEIGKPCLTARFNTDRPETVMEAHSNLLVPPVSREIITKLVGYVANNEGLRKSMASAKKLYGEEVGNKIVKIIKEEIFSQNTFKWAHEVLGLWREHNNKLEYL